MRSHNDRPNHLGIMFVVNFVLLLRSAGVSVGARDKTMCPDSDVTVVFDMFLASRRRPIFLRSKASPRSKTAHLGPEGLTISRSCLRLGSSDWIYPNSDPTGCMNLYASG